MLGLSVVLVCLLVIGLLMDWSTGLLVLLLIILLMPTSMGYLTTDIVQYTAAGNAMHLAACYVLWMVTDGSPVSVSVSGWSLSIHTTWE